MLLLYLCSFCICVALLLVLHYSFSCSKRENFGEDLLALNIQRGRDHGLPGYNAYRKVCGLRQMTSWNQRPTEIDAEYWDKLKEVYENIEDIDLYVGGVGETSVRGGVVGPTFACLIADQVLIKMKIS